MNCLITSVTKSLELWYNMSKGKILTLIILLILTLITITIIIGVYKLGWMNILFQKNSLSKYNFYDDANFTTTTINDQTDDSSKIIPLLNDITNDTTTTTILSTFSTYEKTKNYNKSVNNKVNKKNISSNSSFKSTSNKNTPQIKKTKFYAKGSDLPDQDFDSYGEYISDEEYKYRVELIRNLNIKTIVIDSLSTSNGISQEFYKVAYINKMIPSKILDKIVESKEFRNLIPQKFIKKENKITILKKGEKVVFLNTKIRDLLILWSQGRLSPIQKAWKVSAVK